MTTQTLANPCQTLESYLQRQWQRYRREPIPLQIRCAVRDDRLLVLAEHNGALRVDAQGILEQLVGILAHLPGEERDALVETLGSGGDRLVVNLYLRFLGEQKPYAGQQCLLSKPQPPRPEPPAAPSPNSGDRSPKAPGSPAPPPQNPTPPPESEPRSQNRDRSWRLPLWVWVVGSGMCASAFVGGFTLMLQPCLAGPCQPLMEARKLGQQATGSVPLADDWEDLQTVASQLKQAQTRLGDVPRWSGSWDEAQRLRGEYDQYLQDFQPLAQAFERAAQAQTQTENPPYPLETWRSAQTLWREAVSLLAGIPSDNALYDLAQRKLTQYEQSLEEVTADLQQEEEAQAILRRAEDAAALARLHQQKDQSVESWQSAQDKWGMALQTLGEVPEGTTAYTVAQERLANYRSQLDQVYVEGHRAQIAANLYDQALAKAQEAQSAEAENRWQVASDRWQAALANVQQIPNTSPYYGQAQALVQEYTAALNQAQDQFRRVEAVAVAQQSLDSLCAGSPIVCYFTVTPQLLAVQLTLDYQRTVLTSGNVGDAPGRAAALQNLEQLESQLESLSNSTGIPLELYDPDGSLVGTHRPQGRG